MKYEWKIKTVGELTSYISKGIPPKYTDKKTNSTIVVLNQKCNRDYKVSYEQSRLHDTTKKVVPTDKMLQYGDVLINSTGTGTAGRIAQFFNNDISTTVDGHMIIMRASKEIDYLYYGYALKSYQKKIESFAEGSTGQTEINKQRLQEELLIKYPQNIDLQRGIALILKNIDDKIELNNRINENLEQQAQAIFKSWFVDFEPFGGVMPDYWQNISVYDLANYINGAAFKKAEYGNFGLPIIKIAELKSGITDSTQFCCVSKESKYYIDDKDILFSWSGNPDTSIDTFLWSRGRAILNQHTFRVVSKFNAPAFTYFLLKYLKPQFAHIASNKQTTGLGHVTVADLKRLKFCANEAVIMDFEILTAPIFETIFSINKENQHLAVLRDTLLPKLMNGEIDVSEVKF